MSKLADHLPEIRAALAAIDLTGSWATHIGACESTERTDEEIENGDCGAPDGGVHMSMDGPGPDGNTYEASCAMPAFMSLADALKVVVIFSRSARRIPWLKADGSERWPR